MTLINMSPRLTGNNDMNRTFRNPVVGGKAVNGLATSGISLSYFPNEHFRQFGVGLVSPRAASAGFT